MSMCISERVELDALRERVAELERKLALLTSAWPVGEKRETLHLRDSKRGK